MQHRLLISVPILLPRPRLPRLQASRTSTGWIYSKGGLPASMAFTAVMSALAAPLQMFFIGRIAALAPSAMLHGRSEPGAGWARLPSWHAFLENARLRCC